ncbi:nucleotide sugar dehydrogenase [SAR86 cluster bacterium]|nr:nucleotide sugar dehydrogenase [SAR86 cluster bacterium]
MKKLCVVGLGYVGLTFAIHACTKGFRVHGLEVNKKTLSSILKGKAHFYEPGIDSLIKSNLKTCFSASNKVQKGENYDYVIISVGTPLHEKTKKPNFSHLLRAVDGILESINESSTIILRSTVSVGTTRKIQNYIKENSDLKKVNVSFCPERTIEGKALEELSSLPQIVSGDSEESLEYASNFFRPLANEIVKASSLEEAELTKLFNNTFRDSLFSISNIFSMIGQEFGLDGRHIINLANYNYPRSFIPTPGLVAGPCLEKDAYILSDIMKETELKDYVLAPRKANELLEKKVSQVITKLINKSPTKKILFSGIAFKGYPETNDLRGSSALKILNKLKKYKKNIIVHDFMNEKSFLKKETGYNALDKKFYREKSVRKFKTVFILNNHPKYKTREFRNYIKNLIKEGSTVVDIWDILDFKSDNIISIGQLLIKDAL